MALQLNQKQQRVIDSRNYLLVTGGPGSGKTTTALLKAKSELESLEEGQKILFLSFSNSAINQIVNASGGILDKKDRKRINIQTFHSFCLSIIQSYGGLAGIKKRATIYPNEKFRADKARLNLNEENHIDYLLEKATIDSEIGFDVFSELALQILTKSSELTQLISECFPFIIVDEYQDTDKREWGVIRKLGGNSLLLCLADNKQRIYDFRPHTTGSRIEEYKETFSPEVVDLEQTNFRNDQSGLLTYADAILNRETLQKPESVVTVNYRYPNQVSFALKKAIVDMREALIENGVERPKICVMTRTNKTICLLSKCLYKESGRISFPINHSVLIEEDGSILAERFLLEIVEYDPLKSEIESVFSEFMDFLYCKNTSSGNAYCTKITSWLEQSKNGTVINRNNIVVLVQNYLNSSSREFTGNFSSDIVSIINSLKELSNQYLKQLIETFEKSSQLLSMEMVAQKANELYTRQENYKGIKQIYIDSIKKRQIIGGHQQLVSSVTLMTMHKSKGREYDGIILFDGNYDGSLMLPYDDQNFSRTRTLLRVAITRSRHLVTIVHNSNSPPTLLMCWN